MHEHLREPSEDPFAFSDASLDSHVFANDDLALNVSAVTRPALLSPLCFDTDIPALDYDFNVTLEHDKENVEEPKILSNSQSANSASPVENIKAKAMRSILGTLCNARISPTEFLTHVLEDSECISFRMSFYSDHNMPRFNKLLDTIWMADKGCTAIKNWMRTHAVDLVCDTIYEEFESTKPVLRMSANDVTPEFISKWDINSFMEPIGTELTPVWCCILEAATETKEAKEKQKKLKSRNRLTVRNLKLCCHRLRPYIINQGRNVISAQVHYLQSFHSCKVQIGLGLMAWTLGASRQLISVLNQSCLLMSFPTITKIIEALADRSIEDA